MYRYFAAWRDSGLWASIDHRPAMEARKAEGRAADPSAGIIDSQSAKTTENGGPRGFDAGKKVKGRKRHIVTGAGGLPVAAQVYPADIQDRDGAPALLASLRHRFPLLRHVFADGACAGPKLKADLEPGDGGSSMSWDASVACGVFNRCRGAGWLSRARRLARDFEATIATARTWLFPGAVQILLRRPTR